MGEVKYISTKPIKRIRKYIHYMKDISDDTVQFYYYKFTVLSYKKRPILECKVIFNSKSKEISFDIIDVNNNCIYGGYSSSYGNFEIINKKINKIIEREFKKLGVIKYE